MPQFEFCLDLPAAVPTQERFVVQGWIASAQPIGAVRVASGDELQPMARPDVIAVHGARYRHVAGFRGWLAAGSLRGGSWLDLEFDVGGEGQRRSIELPAPPPDPAANADPGMKRRKLDRIRPLLRRDLSCAQNALHYDFLTPDLRERFGVIDTENVSSYGYDDIALEIIRECREGLVLDAGAGLRRSQYENVVNLEIAAYPSTDVLSVGEELPFVDGCFDAVFSFAVLEHVKDPFRCAREIFRVLKPGGRLYAVVPFLQPYHGYPSHYYNMTSQGLANLFPPELEIVATDVPRYGLPIWTLTWVLNSWQSSLPAAAREEFLDCRVRDLIGDPHHYLARDFVTQLPRERNFELASCTAMLARKRP